MAAPPSEANSVGVFRLRHRRPGRTEPAFRPFGHSANFPEWQLLLQERIQSAFFGGGKGARAALGLPFAPLTIRKTFPNGNPLLGSEFSRSFLAAAKAPGPRCACIAPLWPFGKLSRMAAPPSGANSVGLFRRRQRRPRRFGPAFRPFDHSENFPEWQPTPRKRIQSVFFSGGKGARAALRLHCAPLTIRQTFPNGNPPLGSEFSRPFFSGGKGARAALSMRFRPLVIRQTFPNVSSSLRSGFSRRFSAAA